MIFTKKEKPSGFDAAALGIEAISFLRHEKR